MFLSFFTSTSFHTTAHQAVKLLKDGELLLDKQQIAMNNSWYSTKTDERLNLKRNAGVYEEIKA